MNKNYIEFIGDKFGKWTVLEYIGKDHRKNALMLCMCECGAKKEIVLAELKRGKTKSCKKCSTTGKKLAKDLTGQIFNKLKVIKREDNKGSKVVWLCKCICGNEITVITNRLINGIVKDCGCSKLNKYELINNKYYIGYTSNNEEFYLDKEDMYKTKEYKWHINNQGYVCTNIKNRQILLMHRLIMNPNSNEVVDHKNGDRKDNRKYNLRVCSTQDNSRNTHYQSNNTSGVIGVSKSKGKWFAYITIDYKKKRLGTFDDFNDAVRSRLKAEKEYFGEFAPQQHLFDKYKIS